MPGVLHSAGIRTPPSDSIAMLRKISRTLRAPLARVLVSAVTPPGSRSTDRCQGANWFSPIIRAYACRSP
ncbi:hypothetical protein SANTM175S_01379 [Streptomyces antimycoticus]